MLVGCWSQQAAFQKLNLFIRRSRALDYLDQIISTIGDHLPGSTTQDKNGNVVIMEWGYVNWRNRLYRQDVFSMWKAAVADFKNVSKHRFLFLITLNLRSAPEGECGKGNWSF